MTLQSNEKIEEFNMLLESFLVQMTPFIGDLTDDFSKIIKIEPDLPIDKFCGHALPVREKIMNREESYFTNTDNYKNSIGNDNDILNKILGLKNIYVKLDKESKSNVWDYFQALLVLSEEYVVLKYLK